MDSIASDKFINAIFARKKHKTVAFNHWKWMFGLFFAKTGTINSAAGKDVGKQSGYVTIPHCSLLKLMHWRPDGRWAEGGGGGVKSFDGEKAWSSINHSILSGVESMGVGLPSYTQKPVFNPDLRNPRNVTAVEKCAQLAQPLTPCYRVLHM